VNADGTAVISAGRSLHGKSADGGCTMSSSSRYYNTSEKINTRQTQSVSHRLK